MLESNFYSYLTGALPTLKLYSARLPQSATFPCATYLIVSTEPTYSLSGYAGLSKARVQIDSWGLSYSDAASTADSIRLKLEGFVGTMGTLPIQNCVRINTFVAPPESSDDGSDTRHYRYVSEYYVFYAEATA